MEKIIAIEEIEETNDTETVLFQVIGTTALGLNYGYKYHYTKGGKLVGVETLTPNSLGGVSSDW